MKAAAAEKAVNEILPGLFSVPNIHPLFVHFPIAGWLFASISLAWGAVRRSEFAWRCGSLLMYVGTSFGVVAIVTGFIATDAMGHDTPGHDLVHVHRDIMIGATVAAIVTCGLLAFAGRREFGPWRWTALALACLTAGVLTLGADRGAELVFRYGIGVAGEEPPATGHDHGDHPHPAPGKNDNGHHGTEGRQGNDHHAPAPDEQPGPAPGADAGGRADTGLIPDAQDATASPDVRLADDAGAKTRPKRRKKKHDHKKHPH